MKSSCFPYLLVAALCGCARPPLAHDVAQDAGKGADSAVPDAGAGADAASSNDAGGPRALCRFDERDSPARLALAVEVDDGVVFVMSDGSARVVYRFPAVTADTAGPAYNLGIDQHRGRVAVTDSRWGMTTASRCSLENGLDVCDEADRAVLLNGDGTVAWQKSYVRRVSSADTGIEPLLGDGGDVFLSGVAGGLLIAPDGTETTATTPPIARPFAGPVMPVAAIGRELPQALFAWWRPSNLVEATDLSIGDPLDPFDTGSDRDFLATSGDGTRVVAHARPDRIETLPFPAEIGPGAVSFGSGAWRGFALGGGVVRLNLATGESAQLDGSLPDGLRQMSAGIDDAGALVSVLRDDFMAGVYRAADGAPGWLRIGKTLGQVEEVRLSDVAGTYLVDARGTNGFFVPTQTWQSAPAGQGPELLQTSYQIVRPGDGVDAVIDPMSAKWVRVSADGQCAAYWEASPSGLRLTVHDVARDMRFATAPVTTGARVGNVVWVE